MKKFLLSVCVIVVFLFVNNNAQGNVYLIIGSDTAIWDAMDVAKYNCYYNYGVIPDKTKNYYEVMQTAYRNKFSDSYGQSIKFTWWLMCGNIFRFANNKNVPHPNVMVPYISKKYYEEMFTKFSDELTLHYHTFAWTDYDKDGKFWWNQAKNFTECKNDFYITLAQLLLEENIFPVSFRSGWNYMDNEWQAELDKLLPYSMHNEAPAYRVDTSEPIDNNYDWRYASKDFIPYRPSPGNYQVDGNGKGWNLHSKYIGNITQAQMNTIFDQAKTKDQVVCLWGHVWDDLFPEYALRIDSLAKKAAISNTAVKYKYTSAVEGMQLWRRSNDSASPEVNLVEIISGERVKFRVQTNEPIFQKQPFVALKYIDESYHVVEFISIDKKEWESVNEFDKSLLAKAGLAVTDTLGNLTKKFIKYLPDDIYVDNESGGYSELAGSWTTDNNAAWGLNSRKSVLGLTDSSKARWNFTIASTHYYNVFVQIPKTDNLCKDVSFRIFNNGKLIETVKFNEPITAMDWVYLATPNLVQSADNYIEMVAQGSSQQSKVLSADVIKITPLVRKKWLYLSTKNIDLGFVIKKDTVATNVTIANNGIENLTITRISSKNNFLFSSVKLPVVLAKFQKITIPVNFVSPEIGSKTDTLFLHSDDSFNPVVAVSFNAEATNYFRIIDDSETISYTEFGVWSKSVAQAYGTSSRIAYLNQSPRAYVQYTLSVREKGFYNFSYIVPKTVNASNKALYVIQQGSLLDSIYVNQNLNSGTWVTLKNYYFTNDTPIKIKIADNGKATAGDVLRADAIKLDFTSTTSSNEFAENIPTEIKLFQNYPNPFNPRTIISYQLPSEGFVSLKVYDILGKEIVTLVNEFKQPGRYSAEFRVRSGEYTSGIYFYQLRVGGFNISKKMIMLK